MSYSTNLLLEKTSKSPDWKKFIYENPLSECTFREYNLTADWRRRHDMMTPLFVETVNSFNNDSLYDFNSNSNMNQQQQQYGNNYLRATQVQSLQFQPTQEINSKSLIKPFNWLTQSSLDSFQPSLYGASFTESQSALLFSINRKVDSQNIVSNPRDSDQDILRLRRKFVRDQSNEQQSRFFARKQVKICLFVSKRIFAIIYKILR